MQNKCLTPLAAHEGEYTNSAEKELKIYYGLTETNFKGSTKTTKHQLKAEIHERH